MNLRSFQTNKEKQFETFVHPQQPGSYLLNCNECVLCFASVTCDDDAG